MPQFFFHVCKDSHVPDTTGIELPDLDAAKREAARLMGDEMRCHPVDFWNDEDWRVEVSDYRGLVLFAVYSSGIKSAASSGIAE